MKTFRSLFITFVILSVLVSPYIATAAPTPPTPAPPFINPLQRQAIEQAVRQAVEAARPANLYFMIYDIKIDRIELNADNTTGLVWLMPVDPNSGVVVATEPAVVVVNLSAQKQWQVTLPTDPNYQSALTSLPQTLLSNELNQSFLTQKSIAPLTTQVFTGYYLPWEGGKGKYLSGSIGHFLIYYSCSITTCRYAYDFYDGTRFALEASKSGTVWSYFDGYPNDDHTSGHTNYLVLRDPTTSPVTYQLYYHLAQGTIPAALKRVGAVVNQGDFIANADNTGYSTGNHLHFMVYADPTTAFSSWGNSVDIVFSDVKANGGRPRTQYEATTFPSYGTEYAANDYYVSGNRGATPPTGTLTAPAAWTTITGPTITVSGSGKDNVSVKNLQVAADYDGTWKAISPMLTVNPFTTTIDLCAAGVPDGPVTLGLWVWDNEGTRTLFAQSPRPIVKSYTCQPLPPTCTIGADQVGLFSLPDFQGACSVFSATSGINNAGIYDTSRLGAVGDNSAASIQVGDNVMATLYDLNYANGAFSGRSESFESSDAGLGDNRLGAGRASSLHVKALAAPSAPTLNNPPKFIINQALTAKDSILLTWSGAEGGVEFQVELTNLGNSTKQTSAWLKVPNWSVGNLAAANYSWMVTARNKVGSTPSAAATFTVAAGSLSNPSVRSLPYSDTMQNGTADWTSSGLWRQTNSTASGEDATNKFWISNQSSAGASPSDGNYASSTVAASDLTSPPISIGQGVTAYLRFKEFYHTEGAGPYWDQRRVQISADGGPFQDVYQMRDDPMDWWVYSSFINVSAYAGKTIRIRFHMDIVDIYDNAFAGWRIDDVTVSNAGPDISYAESSPNDSPAQATLLTMNSTVSNNTICPLGDMDYYSLNAFAGETVTFDIDAQSLSPASSLDTYIFLLDSDGKSILAENDDEVSWQIRDSLLTYTFSRSGMYYLKVKSWSYPGSSVASYACKDYFYTLKMYGGGQPSLQITAPANAWIGPNAMTVTAQAYDGGSGMEKVDFLWHSPDFANNTWELLGSDTVGTDGWSAAFNPTGRTIDGSALVVRSTNRAGQTRSAWITNLKSDTTPPTSRLDATLPSTNNSTVIHLTWSAADAGSGISYMEIKYKDLTSGTDWQTWNTTFASDVRQALFMGVGGHQYGFTIHGVDKVGNVEAYDTNPEASTTIAGTCTADSFDVVQPSDSSSASAVQLALGTSQTHNFCPVSDEDWASFTVPSAGSYLVRLRSLGGSAAAKVDVTTSNGLSVLASSHSPGLATGFDLRFNAASAGTYKLHITPSVSGLWGTDVQYSIWVGSGSWIYFPVIN